MKAFVLFTCSLIFVALIVTIIDILRFRGNEKLREWLNRRIEKND